jgi:hypothetical protein
MAEHTQDLGVQLEEAGVTPVITQLVATEQWKLLVREYRIVGDKADDLKRIKRDLIVAIMCGDAEVFEDSRGICVKQFVKRGGPGCPKELTYQPPNTTHVARGGVDETPLNQKWARVAASLAGCSEGEIATWLSGRDYTLMELVAQLFTSV